MDIEKIEINGLEVSTYKLGKFTLVGIWDGLDEDFMYNEIYENWDQIEQEFEIFNRTQKAMIQWIGWKTQGVGKCWLIIIDNEAVDSNELVPDSSLTVGEYELIQKLVYDKTLVNKMKTIKVERQTSMFRLQEVTCMETFEIEVDDEFEEEEEDLWDVMADYVDGNKKPIKYECKEIKVDDLCKSDDIKNIYDLYESYSLGEQYIELAEPTEEFKIAVIEDLSNEKFISDLISKVVNKV